MVMRSTAAFFINVYRDVFTAEFNVYDNPGTKYSLRDKCLFCDIAATLQRGAIWHNDD